jgi:hypothetical protein
VPRGKLGFSRWAEIDKICLCSPHSRIFVAAVLLRSPRCAGACSALRIDRHDEPLTSSSTTRVVDVVR